MTAPARPARAGGLGAAMRQARRGLRLGLLVRGYVALGGAVLLLVAGIMLARSGISDHRFPPFVAGGHDTVITSYSGPLLTTAIAVGAVAGLLLVSAVTDFWRRHQIGVAR